MIIGHFDGASRSNPGEAGAGAYLEEDEQILWQAARYLGQKTNNEAEYTALIMLLTAAKNLKIENLTVQGDSRLVICQVKREWKINLPHLRALAMQVWQLTEGMNVTFEWVKREKNKYADMLSNKALDEKDEK